MDDDHAEAAEGGKGGEERHWCDIGGRVANEAEGMSGAVMGEARVWQLLLSS